MGLKAERILPYVIGVLAGMAWHWLHLKLPGNPSTTESLLSASITFGAIIIGFLSTAKAIIASVYNAPFMGDLRDSGYMSDLVRYLLEAVLIALAFVGVNFYGYIGQYHGPIFQCLWFSLLLCSSAAFVRVTLILAALLKKIRPA